MEPLKPNLGQSLNPI